MHGDPSCAWSKHGPMFSFLRVWPWGAPTPKHGGPCTQPSDCSDCSSGFAGSDPQQIWLPYKTHERKAMMAKVAILLTQGFADWKYALLAGTGGPFYGLDVQFFAPEAGEVHSQGGLVAVISQSLDEIPKWSPNIVVVIGGNIWTSENKPNVSELLKAHYFKRWCRRRHLRRHTCACQGRAS